MNKKLFKSNFSHYINWFVLGLCVVHTLSSNFFLFSQKF